VIAAASVRAAAAPTGRFQAECLPDLAGSKGITYYSGYSRVEKVKESLCAKHFDERRDFL
jgi:hypothetical protein